MPLVFGEQLTDVSDDPQEMGRLLAFSHADRPDAAEVDETEFLDDPEPGLDEGIREKIAASPVLNPPRTARPASARVRKDIRAKTAFLLANVGNVWQARDRHCGSALIGATPEISDALTDIFCDSPDIVKWFTSSGKYMKWMTLAMACQPVAVMVAQHHVFHSIDEGNPEPGAPVDWSQYRAGG